MRVAHVCQSYPPMISGAALMVEHMARGLAERGHAVLVLAASDRGPAYREVADGVDVVRLRAISNPFRSQQRFAVWPGPALLAALRAFEPEVVHLHDPLGMGLPGLAAAGRLRCPVLLTLHSLPDVMAAYAPPVPGLKRLVESAMWVYGRGFAARCQALVAPSAAVAEAVQKHIGRPAHLIASGIDLDAFTPEPVFAGEAKVVRRKYRLVPGLPVILHVGRLDIEKRVDVVLRAAAVALRQAPAQLLIVGDGTQRRVLTRLSRRLGIGDRTHFAGFVSSQDDLASLYRLASVFVMASQTETEGLVAVEAAACGLPVVAVNATSMPEIVKHGVTGYLAPPGDLATMTRRLIELLADPAKARAMGQAGRANMAQTHNFARTLAAYEQLYGELLQMAGQSAGSAHKARPAHNRS